MGFIDKIFQRGKLQSNIEKSVFDSNQNTSKYENVLKLLEVNKRYLKELDKKVNEEIAEYQTDKPIEELADVHEVLFVICEGRGYTV